jgi:hypothetical protein
MGRAPVYARSTNLRKWRMAAPLAAISRLTPPPACSTFVLMSDLTSMAERHTRALTELMELGLALARKHQDRAMAAETQEEERAASLAFHRISRSVRQTLALEAQLERMRRRMLAEEIEGAELRTQQAVARRQAQVKSIVSRLVWAERDGETAEALIEHLDDLLGEDAAGDDFLSQPVADYIDSLCGDLGLKTEAEAEPDSQPDPEAADAAPATAEVAAGEAAPPPTAEPDPPAPPAEPEASPWAGTWSNSS